MDELEKRQYLENYREKKKKGVPFFPDILVKDVIVAFGIFLILILLSYFVGAPLEPRADPADTSYLPRPEWYFRFLFQLLKYFPGNLEVIGVVVIPTLLGLALLALPFLDSHRFRHFSKRLPVVGATAFVAISVLGLSVASYLEEPPPAESVPGDPTAYLYTFNCAGCHGEVSNIPNNGNLFEVISQGKHEGMPPWGGDLSNEEIDSLVGFILSPSGSDIFVNNCGECHDVTDLVYTDPQLLRQVLDLAASQENHASAPFADEPLTIGERSSLANFLVAPDGKRLFVNYCSSCHGEAVSTEGGIDAYSQIISEGGLHRDMPAWGETLEVDQISTLAAFVVDPTSSPAGDPLFQQYCTSCHFQNIPSAESVWEAFTIISEGRGHEDMPVWGEILGAEQIESLAQYAYQSSSESYAMRGQNLFIQNCATCHGEFGEGGANPTRTGDIIAPISTTDYLKTRDDFTIGEIISRGQPDFGMSPFGLSYGGHLDNNDIASLVQFIRSWEGNPPVVSLPEIEAGNINLSGAEIFVSTCAQCHGIDATGGLGPSLRSSQFQDDNTRESIYSSISEGHTGTVMISWGEILTTDQIQELVEFVQGLPAIEETGTDRVSFTTLVMPIIQQNCKICHNNNFAEGNWNSTSYAEIMNSGNNAPVIIPGDIEGSRLAQMLQGNLGSDALMPPDGKLPDGILQVILTWILEGARDN